MDLGKKVNIMINEEIYKWKQSQRELSFELREEITRLENICIKNNIGYKKTCKKKKPAKRINN